MFEKKFFPWGKTSYVPLVKIQIGIVLSRGGSSTELFEKIQFSPPGLPHV
jgi:hypothetical protein